MSMLDVFKTDAFSNVSLTKGINIMPSSPGKLGKAGIFGEEGITTTTIVVEVEEGTLSLIPNVPRGTIPTLSNRGTRKTHAIEIPHAPMYDVVKAEDVQGKRAFGSDNTLETIQALVAKRLARMLAKIEVTLEFHRAKALQGLIYCIDEDGIPEPDATVNLFTLFDLTENTKDFVLGTAGTKVLTKCMEVKRLIEEAMGTLTFTGVKVWCGRDFWDAFITHAKVETAFARWTANGQQGAFQREDLRDLGFNFGGMFWEEYNAEVDGIPFIPAGEARAHPIGASDLFDTTYAPASFTAAVNTVGQKVYAQQELMDFDMGVKMLVQTNALSKCNRPSASVKLHTSN